MDLRLLLLFFVLVGGSQLVPLRALAQENAAESRRSAGEEQAMAHVRQGLQARENGDLERSLHFFEQAAALHDELVITYNLARTNHELGRLDDARRYYGRYLREAPDATNTEVVRAQIEAIEGSIARRDARAREVSKAEADAASAREEAASARQGGPWPWVLGASGVAGVALGATFGGLALGRESRADAAADHRETVRLLREGEGFSTGANVAFAIGGALVLTGALWLIIRGVSRRPERAELGESVVVRF